MLPCTLTLAASSAKIFGFVIGRDLQTGILIALGAVLLFVGTLLRYKFPLKQERHEIMPYAFWANSKQSPGFIGNMATRAAHSASFTFIPTIERQRGRRPVSYLPTQSKPTTEQHPTLV